MHRNSKIAISLSFLTLVSGLYNVNYNYAQTLNFSKIPLNQEDESIESIKLKRQGTIEFKLSEPTDEKLDLDDVHILCNGGNDMTINNISTTDNKTYTLKTPFYKDDTYTLSVKLDNNDIISEEFLYSYDHPTAADVTIDRTSDKHATIDLYGVDEGGSIYYKLVEKNNSTEESKTYNLRARSNPISNKNLTADDIKHDGTKANIKVGYNEIKVDNLEEGKEYDLYYVLEAPDHRTSQVYEPLQINTYDEDTNTGKSKLEKVQEVEQNKIILKFNEPVKNLNLNNISITCPRGADLTTAGAKLTASEDDETYTLDLSEYYMHEDNKYDVTVNMPDGGIAKSSFVSHFDPPTISYEYLSKAPNLSRSSTNKINFEFNSDEDGRLFYGFYDWNGSVYSRNSNTPQAIDAIKGKIKDSHEAVLHAGDNKVEIDLSDYNINSDSELWVVYVDDANNYRSGFADHYDISKFRKR